jgi:hypothetical protein
MMSLRLALNSLYVVTSKMEMIDEPHFAHLSHTFVETEEGDPRHASYHSIVTFQSSTLLRCNNALSPCAKRGAVAGLKGNAAFSIKLQERPLSRSSIRGHQSEIMFGVLVVVFCPDWVAALGFSLGERQIPVIVSSRVVRALWLWSGRIRCPPL